MAKLVYPKEGIYKYCETSFENGSRKLSQAMNECSFDIPSGFSGQNYLNGLYNTLSSYYNEINSIYSKTQQSNSNYNLLESDLVSDAEKMSFNKIKEKTVKVIR